MEDLEKFKKEQEELLNKIRELEVVKSQMMLRLAELQGVIKYLEDKGEK